MTRGVSFLRMTFSVIAVLASFASLSLLLAALLAVPHDVWPQAAFVLAASVTVSFVAGFVSMCVSRSRAMVPQIPLFDWFMFWGVNVLASFASLFMVLIALVLADCRCGTGSAAGFLFAGMAIVCVCSLIPVCIYGRQVAAAGSALAYVVCGVIVATISPPDALTCFVAAGFVYLLVRFSGEGLRRLLEDLDRGPGATVPSSEEHRA